MSKSKKAVYWVSNGLRVCEPDSEGAIDCDALGTSFAALLFSDPLRC